GSPEPAYSGVEIHEGDNATHTLTADDLIHDKDEIRDENSVIFRMNELKKSARPRPPDQPTLQVAPPAKKSVWDAHATLAGSDEELGEHTMISAPPSAMDVAPEDSFDATVVGSAPDEDAGSEESEEGETLTGVHSSSDEDGPTVQ